MDLLRHWTAEYEDERGILHQSVISREDVIENYRSAGQKVEGPFVPESALRGAVEALRAVKRATGTSTEAWHIAARALEAMGVDPSTSGGQ